MQEKLRPYYERVIERTLAICDWAEQVRQDLEESYQQGRWDVHQGALAKVIANKITQYHHLGLRVIDQVSRRALDGEQVPNEEQIFSIFEPYTELLKQGKTAKPIEFGHMIQIHQVNGKFITDYEVYENKTDRTRDARTCIGQAQATVRSIFKTPRNGQGILRKHV